MTDVAGYRATLGVLVPSTNTMVESDLWSLAIPGVTFHAARMYVETPALDSDDAFVALLEQIERATEVALRDVMTCEPDHLVMGMSAPTFWGGHDGHERFREKVRSLTGMEITTGARAAREALETLGIDRVALLTPYQPIMSEQITRYFADVGVEVVRVCDLRCPTATSIARVTAQTVHDAVHGIDGDDVEAILQIGTNLSFARIAPGLEARLGKPVLANNALSAWHAYRHLGLSDRLADRGIVLRDH